jgi:hypothetical protein
MSNGVLPGWVLAAGFLLFLLGAAIGLWAGYGIGQDHTVRVKADKLEARLEGRAAHRHPPGGRHREGSPQETTLLDELPRAGRLELDELPPVYHPFELPPDDPYHRAVDVAEESPTAFTERMAREVEAMIAGWEAQGNYDRHTIQAGHR